jgi:hypothetical protein
LLIPNLARSWWRIGVSARALIAAQFTTEGGLVPDHAMIAEMNAKVAQEMVSGGDGPPQPPQQSAYQAANYHLLLAIYHQLLSMTNPPAS